MAIAADSRDRVAEPRPADDAWTAGALLGAALGVTAVTLAFAPPGAVVVVLALACVGIVLASDARGLPVARGRGAIGTVGDAAIATARGLTRWAQGLSLPERAEPRVAAPGFPAPVAVPRTTGPRAAEPPAGELPAAEPRAAVSATPADPPTMEMPAIAAVAAAPSAPAAPTPPAPPAVSPAAPSSPSTEELIVDARHLESAGDLDGARHALTRAAADGNRLAAMRLGELHQRNGDSAAATRAYRQAAEGDDSLAWAAALSLGVLLEARGDLQGAEAAYRQAAAGDGSASQSATMLLSWLIRRSEHAAA